MICVTNLIALLSIIKVYPGVPLKTRQYPSLAVVRS